MYIYESLGGSRTLCHSYGFACQQRVLKTFPGTSYLRSEEIVSLWHFLVNLDIYIYICVYIYTCKYITYMIYI